MNLNVVYDGVEYTIDLAKAKEQNLLVEVWKPVKLGDRFKMGSAEDVYVLCCPMAGHICLIDIIRGIRWNDLVKAVSPAKPTKEEFLALVGSGYKWSKVTE